jgi:hypothetical protein
MDAKLLEVVMRWGTRCGLDDFEIATAQSLAWYYRSRYDGPELPDSHWARIAVRGLRNGRDLPGCGTGDCDALHHTWQGHGMGEVVDRSPGPDVLAEQKELMERILAEVSDVKREVAKLKAAGMAGREIAIQVSLSQARVSQILREIADKFKE